MQRLRTTLKSLAAKRSFYEEQINYYNQYVKTCLDNLAAKRFAWLRIRGCHTTLRFNLTYDENYQFAGCIVTFDIMTFITQIRTLQDRADDSKDL
jgi:RasGAP C-terminus